jgi:hypothetical protein
VVILDAKSANDAQYFQLSGGGDMISVIRAFTLGIQSAWKEKKLLIVLYAFNLLFAYVITIPVSSMLGRGLSGRPAASEMLSQFDITYFITITRDFGSGLDISRLLITFGLIYMLLNTFFAGGIIATLHDPERFSISRFFSACTLFFRRFLRLFLFSLIFFLVILIIFLLLQAITTSLTEDSATEFWPVILFFIRLAFIIFMLIMVNMLFDYAKIIVVVNDFNSMYSTIKQALMFVMMSMRKTVSLYMLYFLAFLLLLFLYLGIEQFISVSSGYMVLVFFLWSQLYMLIRLFIRLSFFSGQYFFYMYSNTAMPGMTREMLDTAVEEYKLRENTSFNKDERN